MTPTSENIRINAVIEMPAASLQTIVSTIKKMVRPDARGVYRVDTAEAVNQLVSAFLARNGFDDFISDLDNYKILFGKSE